MMFKTGVTLDDDGNFIEVWECDKCGLREKRLSGEFECSACRDARKIREHHIEEGVAGIL